MIPVFHAQALSWAWEAFAFIIIDADGNIAQASPRAGAMFGYVPEALVGQHVNALLVQDPILLEKHKTDIAHYILDPTIRQMNKGVNVKGRYADGSEFPVTVSLGFHDTEHGRYAIASILLADKHDQ